MYNYWFLGKIYSNDIKKILPYKSTLCKITITGETLLKALEHSAFTYDYTNCAIPEKNIYGGFMHMTGKKTQVICKKKKKIEKLLENTLQLFFIQPQF